MGYRLSMYRSVVIGMRWSCCRRFSLSTAATDESQLYSAVPEYPPLFDPSFLGKQRHARQKWYDIIKTLPTVEEKLLEISKGFFGREQLIRAVVMQGISPYYNTLPLELFCTKTHLIQGLPRCYYTEEVDKITKTITEHVRPFVLEAIRICHEGNSEMSSSSTDDSDFFGKRVKDKMNGRKMIDHIFRAITLSAVKDYKHLQQCQVDYNARCDAFWLKGDFPADTKTQDIRKSLLKKYPEGKQPKEPMDIWFQYLGKPYLQVRNDAPLPEFISRDDEMCTTIKVNDFPYDPRSVGFTFYKRNMTSVPGFWSPDPAAFAHTSFHTRERCVRHIDMFGEDSVQEALHGYGVIASFGWLMAQAVNLGFTPFHEITYPLTTQTVITNGQYWSFYTYQLNTIALSLDVDVHSHQNLCWVTDEQKLYESVDGKEVKGFNDNVLETLIKFIIREPQSISDTVNYRPYLREANHADEKWKEIDDKLKYKFANRPQRTDFRETPLWEIIYKKKFNAKIE